MFLCLLYLFFFFNNAIVLIKENISSVFNHRHRLKKLKNLHFCFLFVLQISKNILTFLGLNNSNFFSLQKYALKYIRKDVQHRITRATLSRPSGMHASLFLPVLRQSHTLTNFGFASQCSDRWRIISILRE